MSEVEKFKYLVNKIQKLNHEEWSELLSYLEFREIKKGDFFSRRGKVASEVGFVTKGLLRSFYTYKDGKELTTFFEMENNVVVSSVSFINRTPSFESIRALEDTNLLVLSYSNLQKLYKKYWKMQKIGRVFHERYHTILSIRLLMIKTVSALQKYLIIKKVCPNLIDRAPLGYIASYLNITPETLSRVRKKCKEEKIELHQEIAEFIEHFYPQQMRL